MLNLRRTMHLLFVFMMCFAGVPVAGATDLQFVQALYANTGLQAGAAGGMQYWEDYLDTHTRVELVGNWIGNADVTEAQFGTLGLWIA